MMRLLFAVLSLCLSVHAGAMRVRAVELLEATAPVVEHRLISWGTCVPIDRNHAVTASHVVERDAAEVEIDGKWTEAKVVARDRKLDVALLMLSVPAKDWHKLLDMPELTMWASAGRVEPDDGPGSKAPSPVEGQDVELLELRIGGKVAHANSGAPILVKDSIVAMVVGIDPCAPPKYVTCLPAKVIRGFLEKSGWRGRVSR